jgi:hypothetical protein
MFLNALLSASHVFVATHIEALCRCRGRSRSLTRSTAVIATVHLFANDSEVAFRCFQRVGFPGEPDGRHVDLCLELAGRPSPRESKLLRWVLIPHRVTGRRPHHLEAHPRGSGDRIESRPSRLIDDGNVLHFQREHAPVGAYGQISIRNRYDPIQTRRRDWWVTIVYLISGNRRSPK